MSGYALHPEAFADLDEIWEYIAEHSTDAADRVIADVFDTLRTLSSFPGIGHQRPDLTSGPLRFHGVRDLLIAYVLGRTPLVGARSASRASTSAHHGCDLEWSRKQSLKSPSLQ